MPARYSAMWRNIGMARSKCGRERVVRGTKIGGRDENGGAAVVAPLRLHAPQLCPSLNSAVLNAAKVAWALCHGPPEYTPGMRAVDGATNRRKRPRKKKQRRAILINCVSREKRGKVKWYLYREEKGRTKLMHVRSVITIAIGGPTRPRGRYLARVNHSGVDSFAPPTESNSTTIPAGEQMLTWICLIEVALDKKVPDHRDLPP
ncbi:hypothetical protein ACMD2_15576 [Ananas comosus]|uniref:Uncharacterized protein n=1 Tax=Ananas comosus TaxID=4615 RepID=A0A199UFC1_ANACO|nr:hypothetical protein ACMD2_15576 [Ananas comosus]